MGRCPVRTIFLFLVLGPPVGDGHHLGAVVSFVDTAQPRRETEHLVTQRNNDELNTTLIGRTIKTYNQKFMT